MVEDLLQDETPNVPQDTQAAAAAAVGELFMVHAPQKVSHQLDRPTATVNTQELLVNTYKLLVNTQELPVNAQELPECPTAPKASGAGTGSSPTGLPGRAL